MLTREQLTRLYQEHADSRILSVYLDADQKDPAQRDAWRLHLKQGLSEARGKLEDAAHDEGRAFDAAAELIREAIGVGDSSFLPGRGWVGFATADRLIHAETLPVPMPNLVRWEQNLRIAPYVRALKQSRPVLLVLLNQRQASIYRYRNGELEKVEELEADTFVGDLTDIGTQKRATQRSGIRGKTGTDAAQSILDTASERLVSKLISELKTENGRGEGFLVLGGIPDQVSALAHKLPKDVAERTVERPGLHFRMSKAELTSAVEEAASEMSADEQRKLLDEAIARARSDGRGCLGPEDTEQALQAQKVQTLLISTGLGERDPDYADRLVGSAFGTNGADAHLLTREPGEALDQEARGAAAILRY